MPTVKEGVKAPQFDLPTDDGGRFRLADHAGKSVLLYFYPEADTPACTGEAVDFTGLADAFARKDILVVGISPDSPEKLAKFRARHGIGTLLVSDPERKAIEAYGVWGEKQNYGRTYTGLIRSTVLVDPEGKIARIWRNVRAKGHAARVLKDIG